jgi:hypothetical protein
LLRASIKISEEGISSDDTFKRMLPCLPADLTITRHLPCQAGNFFDAGWFIMLHEEKIPEKKDQKSLLMR